MPEVNNKINIELETLTPLAIGAGAEKDWVLGMDYVIDNNYLYKLNLHKIAAAGIDLQKLTSYFTEKNVRCVKDLIGQRLEEVSDFKMSMPCSSDNDIKAFVKNQLTGKPVVPGSSIKGAIRSILLEYFTQNDRNQIRNGESRIFGAIKDGSDFMRFVKFSDVDFEETALVNTKIFNLQNVNGSWTGGWKHGGQRTDGRFASDGFNTIYEVVSPQKSGTGYLMLSETGFNRLEGNQSYAEKKAKVLVTSRNDVPVMLFKIVNDHTKSYLEKELSFFRRYPTDKSSLIIEGIENLLEEVKAAQNDNSYCIFKMSAGSGFHSITGDWQFDDFTSGLLDRKRHRDAKPKSRKIAICQDEYMLMGFVKMSVMDAETVAEIERQRQERKRLQKKKRQAEEVELKKQADKADEKRREAEAKARMRSEYDSAISEADVYFDTSNKSDLLMMKTALSNFERAAEILSDGGKHSDKIDSIKKIIAGLEVAQAQQDSEEEARQAAIAAGLTILEDKNNNKQYKVQSFKNVSDRVLGWLKKSKNTALPDNQDQYLKVTLSRLYQNNVPDREKPLWTNFDSKMWQEVIRWCGQDRAKAIFDSVMANKV
jgi:hypothetical protein